MLKQADEHFAGLLSYTSHIDEAILQNLYEKVESFVQFQMASLRKLRLFKQNQLDQADIKFEAILLRTREKINELLKIAHYVESKFVELNNEALRMKDKVQFRSLVDAETTKMEEYLKSHSNEKMQPFFELYDISLKRQFFELKRESYSRSGRASRASPPNASRVSEWLTLLGLTQKEFNTERIKAAYRKIALQNHPDKLAGKDFSAEEQSRRTDVFKRVTEAKEGLIKILSPSGGKRTRSKR